MGISPIELRSATAMIGKGRNLVQSGAYIPCLPLKGTIVPIQIRSWQIDPKIAFRIVFVSPDAFQIQKGETLACVIERPAFNSVCRGYKSLASAASSIALCKEDDFGPSLIRVFVEGKEPINIPTQLKSRF